MDQTSLWLWTSRFLPLAPCLLSASLFWTCGLDCGLLDSCSQFSLPSGGFGQVFCYSPFPTPCFHTSPTILEPNKCDTAQYCINYNFPACVQLLLGSCTLKQTYMSPLRRVSVSVLLSFIVAHCCFVCPQQEPDLLCILFNLQHSSPLLFSCVCYEYKVHATVSANTSTCYIHTHQTWASPTQLCPFRAITYPKGHQQVKEPGVFLHSAFPWQACRPVTAARAHSSISVKRKHYDHTTCYWIPLNGTKNNFSVSPRNMLSSQRQRHTTAGEPWHPPTLIR